MSKRLLSRKTLPDADHFHDVSAVNPVSIASPLELKAWLTRARSAKGLNFTAASRLVGVSAQKICYYERSDRRDLPSIEGLTRIAQAYGVAVPKMAFDLRTEDVKTARARQGLLAGERPAILENVEQFKVWVTAARRASGLSIKAVSKELGVSNIIAVETPSCTGTLLTREQINQLAAMAGIPAPITGFDVFMATPNGVVKVIANEISPSPAPEFPVKLEGSEAIKSWLRSVRTYFGLMQTDVARYFGISSSTLNVYENTSKPDVPKREIIERIARFYDVPCPSIGDDDQAVAPVVTVDIGPVATLREEMALCGRLLAAALPSQQTARAMASYNAFFMGWDEGAPSVEEIRRDLLRMEKASLSLALPNEHLERLRGQLFPVHIDNVILVGESLASMGILPKRLTQYANRFFRAPLFRAERQQAEALTALLRLAPRTMSAGDFGSHSGVGQLTGVYRKPGPGGTTRFVVWPVIPKPVQEITERRQGLVFWCDSLHVAKSAAEALNAACLPGNGSP